MCNDEYDIRNKNMRLFFAMLGYVKVPKAAIRLSISNEVIIEKLIDECKKTREHVILKQLRRYR